MTEKTHLEKFGTPWVWVRTSLLMKNGDWEHEKPGQHKFFYREPYITERWQETHHYFHLLSDGTFQNCKATITVEEREWIHEETADRKISRDIQVDFDQELGPGRGSWKGGVTGVLYEMLPGEIPLMTLRRMEREREFNH